GVESFNELLFFVNVIKLSGLFSFSKWITLQQSALCQCPAVQLSMVLKGIERSNQKLWSLPGTEKRPGSLW
ncbi:hypothetical protein DKP78_21670, partial [Enterococcus faecium]